MDTPRFKECDFHVHTEYSGEEQARGFTIERMFEEADRLGLKYVGYSEHWHIDTSPDLFTRIRDEVERLQPRYSVKVLVSAEIDTLDSRGNLSADPVKAASLLDYASAAVSHYGARGVQRIRSNLVEDTVEMVRSLCRIPEITMIMHPQIAYGRVAAEIPNSIDLTVYEEITSAAVTAGKVLDFPSFEMSIKYLGTLKLPNQVIKAAERSFAGFAQAVAASGVRVAPGSDAHNVRYWDGSGQWFGNNAASRELLHTAGFDESRLWYGPET